MAPSLLVILIGPHTSPKLSPDTLVNGALSTSLTSAPRCLDAHPLCHTTIHSKPSIQARTHRSTPKTPVGTNPAKFPELTLDPAKGYGAKDGQAAQPGSRPRFHPAQAAPARFPGCGKHRAY